jgi:hypothetical protein
MWGTAGDELFRACVLAQAEAFARAVRGAPCEGAQGADAVAAVSAAALAAEALADGAAGGNRAAAAP